MKLALIQPPSSIQADLFGMRIALMLDPITGTTTFNVFKCAVAFVKLSGLGRIGDALSNFRSGGGKASLVAGVDLRGTSIQGLASAPS